jgi:hypothetical protein
MQRNLSCLCTGACWELQACCGWLAVTHQLLHHQARALRPVVSGDGDSATRCYGLLELPVIMVALHRLPLSGLFPGKSSVSAAREGDISSPERDFYLNK